MDPVAAGDRQDVRKDARVKGDNETRKDSSVLEFYYQINNSVPVWTPHTLNASQLGPWPTCHTPNLNDKIEIRFSVRVVPFS